MVLMHMSADASQRLPRSAQKKKINWKKKAKCGCLAEHRSSSSAGGASPPGPPPTPSAARAADHLKTSDRHRACDTARRRFQSESRRRRVFRTRVEGSNSTLLRTISGSGT